MNTHSSQQRDRADSRRTARRIAWTAIGLAASLLAVNAQADKYSLEVPQKAVDYADLNLAVPADANTLYVRLQRAAKDVCGPIELRDLRKKLKQRECYREALAGAVATVNHNAITALYQADKTIKLAEQRGSTAPRT